MALFQLTGSFPEIKNYHIRDSPLMGKGFVWTVSEDGGLCLFTSGHILTFRFKEFVVKSHTRCIEIE